MSEPNFRTARLRMVVAEMFKLIDSGEWISGKVPSVPPWSDAKKSLVVETALLGQSLGTFYIHRGSAGQDRLVDGNARLFSLYRFFHGDLVMTGLHLLSKVNGLTFEQLPPEMRTRILETQVDVVEFHRETSESDAAAFVARLDP